MAMNIEQVFNDTCAEIGRVFGPIFEQLYNMYLKDKTYHIGLRTWLISTNCTKTKKIYDKTLLLSLMFALPLYHNDFYLDESLLEVAKISLDQLNKCDRDDPNIYIHTRIILEKYIEKCGK